MKYIDKLKRVEKKVARLKGKNKSLLLGGKGGKKIISSVTQVEADMSQGH